MWYLVASNGEVLYWNTLPLTPPLPKTGEILEATVAFKDKKLFAEDGIVHDSFEHF